MTQPFAAALHFRVELYAGARGRIPPLRRRMSVPVMLVSRVVRVYVCVSLSLSLSLSLSVCVCVFLRASVAFLYL